MMMSVVHKTFKGCGVVNVRERRKGAAWRRRGEERSPMGFTSPKNAPQLSWWEGERAIRDIFLHAKLFSDDSAGTRTCKEVGVCILSSAL